MPAETFWADLLIGVLALRGALAVIWGDPLPWWPKISKPNDN